MTELHFHGELYIITCEEAQISGSTLELVEDLKLADSETTGNHHMLQVVPGLQVYEDRKAEKFFVKVPRDVETKIYCKISNRHTDLKLPSGTYEIGTQREWDHLKQESRKVLD